MIMFLAAMLAAATPGGPVQSTDVVQAREHLASAAGACRSGDFDSFLTEFIWSRDVRQRYTSPTIEERSFAAPSRPGIVRRADPDRFDIAKIDYSYADELSVRRWERDGTPFVELSLDLRKLPGGGWHVQYQPGIFHDDGEGDGKTLIRKTGKPRAYIFAPVSGCWKLVRQLR